MTAELKPITGMRESVEDLNGTVTEYSYVTPDEETVRELTSLLFEERWREIVVGPCIEGAVFEIRFEQPPKKVSYLDGYLTVDFGYWHFHLCVGKHKGARSPELAAKRRVARLAFFEMKDNRCIGGGSYGLRMWNGFDEQMTTIFLPNPRLSDDQKVLKEPQWDRLRLWFELRNRLALQRAAQSGFPLSVSEPPCLGHHCDRPERWRTHVERHGDMADLAQNDAPRQAAASPRCVLAAC